MSNSSERYGLNHKNIIFSSVIIGILVTYPLWWLFHLRPATVVRRTLFEGIIYLRDVLSVPRPIITHVITIDLNNPHIHFLVTPGEKSQKGEIMAHTTSYFLKKFNLQVAINGSFFYPFHSNSPWDYYPYEGDPVNVIGFASSRGKIYSDSNEKFKTLYISSNNKASFTKPNTLVYNALSGREFLLVKGKIPTTLAQEQPYPRTAIALNQATTLLMLIVIDGKQTGYSEGVTLIELAEIIQTYGGYTALNLDGGGSSTMVTIDMQGNSVVLNSPIHTRIPGRERPVANHLGIYFCIVPELCLGTR